MARRVSALGGASTEMIVALVAIFLLIVPAEAYFRLLCFNPLGFGRIDPIMSPGKPSKHLHHLHGSGNLGIDSVDANYLLEANCTSCSIVVDKSGYWAPSMYFQHANGSFELMSTSGSITIYYKTEKRVNFLDQNYTAFPKGFRMVAGDNNKRAWVGPWPIPAQSFWQGADLTQEALASKSLGFNCLNYARKSQEATFAYGYMRPKDFIDTNCLQGVRAEVLFPSCWDGVNLDSPDHKSHVAYPTLLQDGACPKTHPIYLPILFYETIWNTQDFIGKPGQFVFSNGDPTGYGYHADFIAAWEDGVLERVMADPNCTDQDIFHRQSGGLQEQCPIFNGHLQSQADAAQCKLEVPEKLGQEKAVVGDLLAELPGGVPVTGHRHDPGTDPIDFPAPGAPLAALSSIIGSSSSAPSGTVAPPPSTNSLKPNPTSPAPVVNSSPPAPTTSTAAVATTSVAGDFITSTRSYTSNGVYYESVLVQQIVTVTRTYIVTNTATVTPSAHTPVHGHGRFHRNIL